MDNIETLTDIANGFQQRGDNPLWGCVGAVDGLNIKITQPPASSCPNPKSYFNRKGHFSFNLQAVCDFQYRCRYASCRCAG
jgi:hypothetical protein